MMFPRLASSLFGIPVRVWGLMAVGLFLSLVVYQHMSDINQKILILSASNERLEEVISQLQVNSHNEIHSNHPTLKDPQDDMVLLYNRVPKTGSTSFAGMCYELCEENAFHAIHFNITRNQRVMSLADQRRFVLNVTNWTQKKPAIYHGHLAFIDFTKFGVHQQPVYINIVRDPLDRLISYYYFVRYGDDFHPSVKRRKAGDQETFDECVERQGADCDPDHLWMQIPYFCGHHDDCWDPGNEWALEEAKINLLHHFLLVGNTENMRDFVAMLELTLPRFFKGASRIYDEGPSSHLRRTAKKKLVKQKTIDKIRQSTVWKMENEFYDFAVNHFKYLKRLTLDERDGEAIGERQKFMYEKIRPKQKDL